jgi:hypothetical protein
VGGTEGRVTRTDNDDITGRRQHAFSAHVVVAPNTTGVWPGRKAGFCPRQPTAANGRFRGRRPSIHAIFGEVQKWSNQDALTMLKVGTDVNFSQSEIFQ